MKLNILKNNMRWGVSQEKKNICNLFLKMSLWMEVPRRVILEKNTPQNVAKSHSAEVEEKCIMV